MRALVTGASGLLGSEVLASLANKGFTALALDRTAFLQATGRDRSAIFEDVDVVVHTAANTNVEQCEASPEACYRDNCFLTEQLFHQARRHGVKFVFISSTGVYGRGKIDPYHEYDTVSPTTVHHRSKWISEQLVLSTANTLVVRTGWLFGGPLNNRKNFVANRLSEVQSAHGAIHANTSQVGSPTYVHDCAERLIELISGDCTGIYNVVNDQSASRFEYVKRIVELSGALIDVRPINATGFNRLADVSENESAISYRMRFEGRTPLRPWKEALEEYMQRNGTLGSLAPKPQ